MDRNTQQGKYEVATRRRQQHVEAVLVADSRKNIVVAGPGTGKTYLFRILLDGKKNTLTLTFVNTLVRDLSLDLFGLSEVRTLHSFARQQLAKAAGKTVNVFPKLSTVIKQDAVTLLGREVDFDYLFHNKSDRDEDIDFYRKRRVYYDHYGYSDMVYAAVRFFEVNPDRVPVYSQVVVDEFQDFNTLEVSLIDLLASKSPILLAGDDDQAVYETLKSASVKHIRQRYSDEESDYQNFTLPFCSRCTRVIVDATNDIISNASKAGYLKDRIDKQFLYFDDPEKDKESERNPQIVYAQVYPAQIPWFIQERVKDIATELRDNFSILLISPTRNQCGRIVEALRNKGFENIQYVKKQENVEPTILEGLKLLLENNSSNLGWRIVARALLPVEEFESILRNTANDNHSPQFYKFIGQADKKEVRALLKDLRAVRDNKDEKSREEMVNFLYRLEADFVGTATEELREQIRSPSQRPIEPGLKNIIMKATTIASAKGLAADYVFITHFDDRFFIKNSDKKNITDQDICSFIVALTRARKRVFLISSDTKKKPTFLEWIDNANICTTRLGRTSE